MGITLTSVAVFFFLFEMFLCIYFWSMTVKFAKALQGGNVKINMNVLRISYFFVILSYNLLYIRDLFIKLPLMLYEVFSGNKFDCTSNSFVVQSKRYLTYMLFLQFTAYAMVLMSLTAFLARLQMQDTSEHVRDTQLDFE